MDEQREDGADPSAEEGPVSYLRRVAWLATTRGDRPVLRFAATDGSEQAVSWSELDVRSTQIGRALADRGVGAGDRVAVGLRNSPAFVEVVLATWKLGATPVPLRWDLPTWEQERVLAVIDPAAYVAGADLAWLDATAAAPAAPLPEIVAPVTHGICSSGSTGTPKVILIDRPGLWDTTIGQPFPTAWIDVPRPQVVLVPAPMYHTNGFAALYNLLAGDDIVVMERFDAARVVDLVERHQVTTFTATPTMLQRIAALPGLDDRDLSSIVWILQGAAGISPALVERWLSLVGPERFFMSYGMTEGLGLACLRGDEWLERRGSVGRGYRETEIRIKGSDGELLGPGEIGEIWLRSPSTGMYRYLGGGDGGTTKDEDGFATAGDLGHLDADGFLSIVDRRVDMVVTGGANVYPAEVENALIEHPAIADVVVIGLPDDEWGRRVHAIVEPADPSAPPTAEDVIAFAKDRLAPYKVPKSVELVDAIPRSEATKVSRSALVAARGG